MSWHSFRSDKHQTKILVFDHIKHRGTFDIFPTQLRESVHLPEGVGPLRQPELTHAGPVRRQLEAWRALAAVAARNVKTVGVALAQVVSTAALIDVYRARGGRGGRQSQAPQLSTHAVRQTEGQEATIAPF